MPTVTAPPPRPLRPSGGRLPGRTAAVVGMLVIALVLAWLALGGASAQADDPTVQRVIEPTPVAPGDAVTVTTTVDPGGSVDGTLVERLEPGVAGIEVLDDGGAGELVVDESAGTIEATYDGAESITLEYRVDLLDDDESVTINGSLETEDETYDLRSDEIPVTTEPIFELRDLRHPDETTTAERFDVSVDVENRGASDGSIDLDLFVDGERRTERSLDIGAGSTETVDFEGIHLESAGEHQLQVRGANATINGTVNTEAASGELTYRDQAIGTDAEGESAIVVSDVQAETGWHLVATDGLDGSVIGTRSLNDVDGEDVILPVDNASLPGPVDVHLVALADGLTVGEPIPDDAVMVASDDGRVLETTVSISDQTFVNEAPSVVIDRVEVRDGREGSTPYVVALHRRVGESLREVVGTSSVLWGENDEVEVDLDEPVAGGERLEIAAVVYFADGGTRDEAIHRLDEGNPSRVRDDAVVQVESQAILSIDEVSIGDARAGDAVQFEVTLRNEGRITGSESLWLSVGPHVDVIPVTVGSDETTTVTSTWETDRDDAGIHDVLIETRDDTHTDTLTVADPASTPTSTPGDDQPGLGVAIAIVALAVSAVLARFVRG